MAYRRVAVLKTSVDFRTYLNNWASICLLMIRCCPALILRSHAHIHSKMVSTIGNRFCIQPMEVGMARQRACLQS